MIATTLQCLTKHAAVGVFQSDSAWNLTNREWIEREEQTEILQPGDTTTEKIFSLKLIPMQREKKKNEK